jgi:mannose-6-phosphate isomerase-like protein (cupin superfamily)
MKERGTPFTNGPTCEGISYVAPSGDYDVSVISISGRYPETGTATNKISHETVYIAEGSGRVVVDEKEQELSIGDVVSVAPNTKFFWQGNMKLIMTCQPAFSPGQYVLE